MFVNEEAKLLSSLRSKMKLKIQTYGSNNTCLEKGRVSVSLPGRMTDLFGQKNVPSSVNFTFLKNQVIKIEAKKHKAFSSSGFTSADGLDRIDGTTDSWVFSISEKLGHKKTQAFSNLGFGGADGFDRTDVSATDTRIFKLQKNIEHKKTRTFSRSGFGGAEWIRTTDSRIFSPMLYQLSYSTD